MAISPIGNLNYVNQNAALPSTQVSNELAKEGFASIANLNEFKEKEKAIEKLEKVAQTNAIDEEVKEKTEEEENKKRKEKSADEQDEDEETDDNEKMEFNRDKSEENQFKNSHQIHHLDISI